MLEKRLTAFNVQVARNAQSSDLSVKCGNSSLSRVRNPESLAVGAAVNDAGIGAGIANLFPGARDGVRA